MGQSEACLADPAHEKHKFDGLAQKDKIVFFKSFLRPNLW